MGHGPKDDLDTSILGPVYLIKILIAHEDDSQ